MLRRWFAVVLVAAVASMFALPAQAADVEPPKLGDASLSMWAPAAYSYSTGGPPTQCTYSLFNCGVVDVKATFTGLDPSRVWPYNYLTGTAKVTETYGCADADGTRLGDYDTKVRVDTRISTRWQMPISIPDTPLHVYGPVYDNQPHNCPAGTTAMLYEIRANCVKLTLVSSNSDVPDETYAVPGKAVWIGAVRAPVSA